MTTLQKVIKYLAIGFAVFLIAVIINTIIGGIELLTEGFSFIDNSHEVETDENYNTFKKYDEGFDYLNIDLNSSNLIIKPGEDLTINTNNKNIKILDENNKLKIVDKTKKIINNSFKDIIITIPLDLNFDGVNISTGAGKVNIDGLYTYKLEMELGAGKVSLNNINSEKTKIETGAGNVDIKNSNLNNLDLELGVGEININGNITGDSSIESGIGSLNLNLTDSLSMYKFDFEKGLGEILVNGEKITDNEVISDGNNYIKVEGGIGSIKINTLE